ncbi:MAG: FecR domain-containing protein [Spirochaetes bacterium]|nr:FecR domain-containing protein [Spirochaetota bacterium]
MISKKDWIDKLDDKTLDFLLNNQTALDEMPENLKIKLKYMTKRFDHESEKAQRKTLVFQFVFSFTIIIILLIGLLIGRNTFLYHRFYSMCKVIKIDGKAYKIVKGKKYLLHQDDIIKEKTSVYTENDSQIQLEIDKKSRLELNQLSEIKINRLKKNKKIINNSFYLKKGMIKVRLAKLIKGSLFKITTTELIINVIGTEFEVNKSIDETTITVIEGKIWIKPNLDQSIQKELLKKNLYSQINKIINEKVVLTKDQSIIINSSDVKKFDIMLKETILFIKNIDFSNQNDPDTQKKIMAELDKKLFQLKKSYQALIIPLSHDKDENNKQVSNSNTEKTIDQRIESTHNNEEEGKKEVIIRKLPFNPQLQLDEKETSLAIDNNNIYITSDSNKSLTAVDIKSGKLLWKFTHHLISKLTSPALIYQKNLIISTSNHVFIISKQGKLLKLLNINDGPVYWAKPEIHNDSLLIPANDILYILKGNSLEKTNNIFNTSGQLYITKAKPNILYFYNINSKKLAMYNLNKNIVTHQSTPLKHRAFMKPVFANNYIFIADSIENIYRFDTTFNDQNSITLKLPAGVVSEIIYHKPFCYFIGNDGVFYKLNSNSFDLPQFIIQVDKNPDSNNYLVKKPVLFENSIYYCSDKGKLFSYDLKTTETRFLKIPGNQSNNPLICTPLKLGNVLYFIDLNSNIYTLSIH